MQQLLLKHDSLPDASANLHVQKVLHRLKICRTASLGYHIYRCTNDECGEIKYQYHSCRDRHCPQCGAIKKDEWIEARMQELLPVKYYHVVFTLPHELNSLVSGHRKILYNLLFDASAQTLLSFAKDEKYMGAVPGIISILHTWGQQLSFHPHIHSIVSGGGIMDDNNWKDAKKNIYRFLFPLKAMSVVYKTKFLQAYRISSVNDQDDTVTFAYKDYSDANKQKQMTLSNSEFVRRFTQHILPKGFTKIRTYGYLSNRNRHQRINEVLRKMKLPQHKGLVKIPLQLRMIERYGIDVDECPCCKQKTLQLLKIFYPWKKADDG